MSAPINRQPAGTSTGGQFAPAAHAESDVELDATAAPAADPHLDGYRVVHRMPVEQFTETFLPGEYDFDDWDGVAEHESFLDQNPFNTDRVHAGTWDAFVADVAANGIREPVTIDWYDPAVISGGHHRVVAAMQTGRDVPFVYETQTASFASFDELPETAQLAIRNWSPAADHVNAEQLHRERGHRYEIETVPMAEMKARIFDTNREMADDFGDFARYHDWYCSGGDIPSHGDSRWPVIEADADLAADAEYLDDGWHRFHSYVRSGHASVDVLRVLPGTGH